MKKLFILTSVLALAACGGGGGGGSHGGGSVIVPSGASEVRTAFLSGASDDNSAVTSMTSAIVIANDGSESAVYRSAAGRPVTHKGKDYTIFDLSNVNFHIAEDPTASYFQFNVDDHGAITEITETLGGASVEGVQRTGTTQRFNTPMFEYVQNGKDQAEYRIVDAVDMDDTTHYRDENGRITLETLAALESENGLSGGHWNRIDEVLDISTEGEAVGLTFSDFGKFNPVYRSKHKWVNTGSALAKVRTYQDGIDAALDADDVELAASLESSAGLTGSNHSYKTAAEREDEFANSEDFQLFAGGYAIKDGVAVDTLIADNKTSYTGTAIGRVYTSIQSNGVDRTSYLHDLGFAYDNGSGDGYLDANNTGHDVAKVFKTNAAKINVDESGNQTIYMPFFKAGVGDDKFYNVTITDDGLVVDAKNAQNVEHPEMIDARYRVYDALDHIVDEQTKINSGFYGIDTPSEAAGTARLYSEQNLYTDPENDSNYVTREYELQAAWGMKRD